MMRPKLVCAVSARRRTSLPAAMALLLLALLFVARHSKYGLVPRVLTANEQTPPPPPSPSKVTDEGRADAQDDKFALGNTLGRAVDRVYVVNLDYCVTRWSKMQQWAAQINASFTRMPASSYDDVDPLNPPADMGIAADEIKDGMTSGQLGCAYTHRRIWKDALANDFGRVLVLEDDLFVKPEAIRALPNYLEVADAEAKRRQTPWHYMFLYRHPLRSVRDEETWAVAGDKRRLTLALESWGNAAYVLTREGARVLLEEFSEYRAPIDVQLAALQNSNTLVAISACDNEQERAGCPENVAHLPLSEQGECDGSTSQKGHRFSQQELLAAKKNARQKGNANGATGAQGGGDGKLKVSERR